MWSLKTGSLLIQAKYSEKCAFGGLKVRSLKEESEGREAEERGLVGLTHYHRHA